MAEPAAAAGKLVVIPGEFDWDDVGDFASIAKLHSSGYKKDLAILGEGARVLSDSSNGIVVSEAGRTIAVVGVKDIVIVDTPDALLITTTANAQRVKSVVDALRLADGSSRESEKPDLVVQVGDLPLVIAPARRGGEMLVCLPAG